MILLALALSACGQAQGSQAEQLALEIRGEYLDMQGCTARAELTADYGQRVYQYTVDFRYVRDGESVMTLAAPENVAGVTARLDGESAVLEFDGTRLETGPLGEHGISPVQAPDTLLAYAREGFMAECGMEEQEEAAVLAVVCRDPQVSAGTGEEVTLWFDPDTHALLRGEISQDGFTVIQCEFTQFQAILGSEQGE